MSVKSKNRMLVYFPRGRLESYFVLAMVLMKGRPTTIHEYSIVNPPSVISLYNKTIDVPFVMDFDTPIGGSFHIPLSYLEKRYPVPPLLPGELVEQTRHHTLCATLLSRLNGLTQGYIEDKDADKWASGVLSALKNAGPVFKRAVDDLHTPSLLEALFSGLVLFMDDNRLSLSSFSALPEFILYTNSLKKTEFYAKIEKALDESRTQSPFWESDSFVLPDSLKNLMEETA